LFQQLFHSHEEIAGGDDTVELLALAKQRARLRVVVKRPRKAEPLAQQAPSYALEGKAVRFDVYIAQ